MTFGDIKNLVLTWLDDPNGGYFTDAIITVWINHAQFEVAKMLVAAGENFYLICKETQTVINQPLYLLPEDFLKVNRMELILDGTPPTETKSVIAPITFNQQDYMPAQRGNPESYVLKKNAIFVVPTPDTVRTLRLNYSYRVAPMSLNSDQPDVPEQYHEMIAVLATMDGLLKDNRDMSGMMAKREYYEKMMKEDADQRTLDQPRTVVVTEDDGFGRIF